MRKVKFFEAGAIEEVARLPDRLAEIEKAIP